MGLCCGNVMESHAGGAPGVEVRAADVHPDWSEALRARADMPARPAMMPFAGARLLAAHRRHPRPLHRENRGGRVRACRHRHRHRRRRPVSGRRNTHDQLPPAIRHRADAPASGSLHPGGERLPAVAMVLPRLARARARSGEGLAREGNAIGVLGAIGLIRWPTAMWRSLPKSSASGHRGERKTAIRRNGLQRGAGHP